MRQRWRQRVTLLAIAAIAAVFVWEASRVAVPMDDAYISLRYADNLVQGRGLVFNPGERVEGFSNFSWTLLLALLLEIGLPALAAAKWLGIACATAAVLLAARFCRDFEREWGPASLLCALLSASCLSLAFWAGSGMETAFFTLLLTAAAERGLALDRGENNRRLATLLLALSVLTRPEGFLLTALWFVWMLWRRRAAAAEQTQTFRPYLAAHLGLAAAVILPFLAFKVVYYGELLPNTYYAKAGFDPSYLRQGMEYSFEVLGDYASWGAGPLLALLVLQRAAWRAHLGPLLAAIGLYSGYVVLIGGDVLPFHRFWLPWVPLSAALVSLGTLESIRWMRSRNWRHPARWVWATLFAAVILSSAARWQSRHDAMAFEARTMEKVESEAAFFAGHFPSDTILAASAIGAMGYLTDFEVVDMLGLINPEVSRDSQPIAGIRNNLKEKRYNAAAVLRRQPDLIYFVTGLRPAAAAEKALFLFEHFHRAYAPFPFHESAEGRAQRFAWKRRPDAPPPPERLEPVVRPEAVEAFAAGYRAYAVGDDLERAERLLLQATQDLPFDFPAAREWLALTRFRRDREAAVGELVAVVEADSLALLAQRALATHLLTTDDFERAEPYLRRLIRLEPHEATGYLKMAQLLTRQGDLARAERVLQMGLERSRVEPRSWLLMAELRMRRGDFTGAEQAIWRAEQLRGRSRSVQLVRQNLQQLRRAAQSP